MKTRILLIAIVAVFGIYGCSSTGKTTASKSKSKTAYVLISTTYGDMKVKLYNETPIHKANFLSRVNEGFYDSLAFHRVIKDFMIQGGDPVSRQSKASSDLNEVGLIPAEFRPDLFHKKGALAAARTGGPENPEKKSSDTQFYIVQGKVLNDNQLKVAEKRSKHTIPPAHKEVYKEIGGTPHLDQNYTVFGEVVEGLNIIDKIASVKTGAADKPKDLVIFSMKVVKK